MYLQIPPREAQPARFYQLILQEDLLGGWTLIRQWGITGQRGSQRREYFDDLDAAQQALSSYRDRQLRDGYSVTFIEGEERR